jgi:hypothetical protein
MFPHRYFALRYFAGRYFGQAAGIDPVVPSPTDDLTWWIRRRGWHIRPPLTRR